MQPQQSQQWPMMYQQPNYPFPSPMPPMPNYYMYLLVPPMQYPMPQSQPNINQMQTSAPAMFSPPNNNPRNFSRQMSLSHSVSDYSNHGDCRLSYDPGLSPVVHV